MEQAGAEQCHAQVLLRLLSQLIHLEIFLVGQHCSVFFLLGCLPLWSSSYEIILRLAAF